MVYEGTKEVIKEFYKKHYRRVLRDIENYPRKSPKLKMLWNAFRPDRQKTDTDIISDDEHTLIKQELENKLQAIDNIPEDNLLSEDFCLAGCSWFHETGGVYEIHRLKGGFEIHYEAKGDHDPFVKEWLVHPATKRRRLLRKIKTDY